MGRSELWCRPIPAPQFKPDDIRIALSLGPEVPILLCDARKRDSVKQVLISLVRYVMSGRNQTSQRAMS